MSSALRSIPLLLVISALIPAVGCAQERPQLPRGHEPAPHADGGEAAWPEPAVVFDSLWSVFHHTYALFGDKSVPWRAVGDAYRPRALRATTEDELFDVLAEMLATLNDNHVKLTGWSRIMSAAGDLRYAGPPEDFSAELIRQRYLLAAPQERAGGSIAFGWLPTAGASSDATASPVRLPLADSLAVWIDERGLAPALERFQRLRADTARWFLAEDWEYGDLTTLGRGFLQEDDVDAAVAVLEAAAAAYPRSYRPHLWLARAHERAGRDREADIARRRAIALNPEAYSADRRAAVELSGRIPLSYVFLDRLFGEGVDAAVRTYRTTKAEHPERVDIDPLVLVRGGQQLREGGQSEAARDVFAFTVEEFPRSTIGHLGLAQALRDVGDVDAARQAYRRAVAVDPGNRAAREGLASLENP